MADMIGIGNANAERPSSPKKNMDWRQLCAAAAVEQDSGKLTVLVDQLIQALDDRNPHLATIAHVAH